RSSPRSSTPRSRAPLARPCSADSSISDVLARRIIPCLDVRDGRTVKGVNFVGLRDAGDPVELAARYAAEGADELVFLDVTATVEKRETARELALRVGRVLDIPFTIDGGV